MKEYLGNITLINVSDGAPGATGPMGPAGPSGDMEDSYRIETNQDEIIKFIANSLDENGQNKILISPEVFEIWATIKGSDGQTVPILNLTPDGLSIEAYGNDGWYIPEIQYTFDTENQKWKIDLLNSPGILKDIEETTLKFEYNYSNYKITKIVNVRYGMTKDMATLSVVANGLTSSIQNSKLFFDATGLTVQNGGLRILNKNKETVVSSDSNTGNLTITGTVYANNGYFKGRIEAEEGYFKGNIEAIGTIQATGGLIGGFEIQEKKLVSRECNVILDGTNGNIYAKEIILGIGAQIEDYIKLGDNIKLSTATGTNPVFLSVKRNGQDALEFNAEGKIQIGNENKRIIINGEEGSIYSQGYNRQTGWIISNGESVFNNVVIRGSIKSSVLEYGEVQSVGGILLIRPSSRITSAYYEENVLKLSLENLNSFKIGDICLITIENEDLISKIYGTISEISEKTISLIDYTSTNLDASSFVGQPINNLGSKESGNNIGIGINGSNDGSLITPNAISVFETDGKDRSTPRIILGKLPNKEEYGFARNTYGLYAENALLSGSLITKSITKEGTATYCGMSTSDITNAPMSTNLINKIGGEPSEILIWAGAESDKKEAIENSNFFVDRKGNFYSNSGYFSGSIITNSTIEASEIKAVKITGLGKGPALTIADASTGIRFLRGEEIAFDLTKTLAQFDVQVKVGENFQISRNGEILSSAGYFGYENGLKIQNQKIESIAQFQKESFGGEVQSYINFDNGIRFSSDGIRDSLYISKNEIFFQKNLQLGQETSIKYGEKVSYQPVYFQNKEVVGYDLYIFE